MHTTGVYPFTTCSVTLIILSLDYISNKIFFKFLGLGTIWANTDILLLHPLYFICLCWQVQLKNTSTNFGEIGESKSETSAKSAIISKTWCNQRRAYTCYVCDVQWFLSGSLGHLALRSNVEVLQYLYSYSYDHMHLDFSYANLKWHQVCLCSSYH